MSNRARQTIELITKSTSVTGVNAKPITFTIKDVQRAEAVIWIETFAWTSVGVPLANPTSRRQLVIGTVPLRPPIEERPGVANTPFGIAAVGLLSLGVLGAVFKK